MSRIQALLLALGLVLVGIAAASAHDAVQTTQTQTTQPDIR